MKALFSFSKTLTRFFAYRLQIWWKGHEVKRVDPSNVKMIPKQGFAYNPLLGYPVNERCFCGSGTKAKKCCMPKLKRAVPSSQVEYLSSYVTEVKRRANAR